VFRDSSLTSLRMDDRTSSISAFDTDFDIYCYHSDLNNSLTLLWASHNR
jgi:hypothetical protein